MNIGVKYWGCGGIIPWKHVNKQVGWNVRYDIILGL